MSDPLAHLPPPLHLLTIHSAGNDPNRLNTSTFASFSGRTVFNSENPRRVYMKDLEEMHDTLEEKLLNADLQPDGWRSIEQRFATVVKNSPGYKNALAFSNTGSPSLLSGVRNEMRWHDDFRGMMQKVMSSEKLNKTEADNIFDSFGKELTKYEHDELKKEYKRQKGSRNERLEGSLSVMVTRHGEAFCIKVMSTLKASNWGQRVLPPPKGSDNGFPNQASVSRSLTCGSNNGVSQSNYPSLRGMNFDSRRGHPHFITAPSGNKDSNPFQRGERNYQSFGPGGLYSGTSAMVRSSMTPAIDNSSPRSILEELSAS